MALSDIDHALIPSRIVDAIGCGFSNAEVGKIIHIHLFRLSNLIPCPSRILEFAYEFLFLCVNGYHGKDME